MKELLSLQKNQFDHDCFVEKIENKFEHTKKLLQDKRSRADIFRFIAKKDYSAHAKGESLAVYGSRSQGA